MIIGRRKQFVKHYQKLSPKLKHKTEDAIVVFEQNPFEPSLRNHALSGGYIGFRSIDVTGDYRIIFRELSYNTYELVELIDIGSHSQLYE